MKKIRIAALGLAVLMTIGSMCACDGDGDPVPDGETVKGTETSHTPDEGTENSGSSETEKPGTGTTSSEESTEAPQSPVKTWNDYSVYSIGAYRDGLAPLETTDGYGYVNTKGEVVIPPIFSEAEPFHNSVARIKQDNGYGYIDTTGKILLEPVYDELPLSFEDIICAKKGDKRQYLTIDGTVIYTETGDEVKLGEVSNGYFWVETVEELLSGNVHTVTYYGKDGEAFSFENVKHLNDINEWGYGLVQDKTDKQRYLFNTAGKLFWYPDQGEIISAGRDYICFEKFSYMTTWWYIDYETLELDECQPVYGGFDYIENGYYMDSLEYQSSQVRIYKENKMLFDIKQIDEFKEANMVIVGAFAYDGADYFWVVMSNDSGVRFTSLVDVNGKIVVDPIANMVPFCTREQGLWEVFSVPHLFVSGLCIAVDTKTELYGYIDIQGNWVIEPQYTEATDFWGEGDDAVAVVNGNTVINRKGEVIFSTNGQN